MLLHYPNRSCTVIHKLWCLFPLLFCIVPAFSQTLVNRSILSGNGSDQPTVIATGKDGFVYIAGDTTSGNFPVTNALETLPPQGALEVSANGAAFVNTGLAATSVNAVAASSDGHLVIASTSSGIFRSTDQGVTWSAASDVLPLCAALAVDPVNPSNVYAVLLQGGAFYKSANGGVNWQNTGLSFPDNAVEQIAINPQTPTTMYVWASYMLYRSTDGGQSWQPLAVPDNASPVQIAAFALAPSQPNVIYSTGLAPFGSFYKSIDGGATWTQGAQNVFAFSSTAAIAVDPGNASTVWVASDGIYVQKSTDGGATFQDVTTLNLGQMVALYVAIDPANSLRVYVSDGFGVFETSDGGQTWSTTYNGFDNSLYAAPSRVYAVGGGIPQTVFLAKFDAGLSQVIYSTYLWTGSVSGIASDGAGDVYLAGSDITGINGMVMKVSAADSSVLYSTPLTGVVPSAIAVDAGGNAVIAGTASSLATTSGAYQSAVPGPCTLPVDPFFAFTTQLTTHAFAAKLNPSGALVNATYIAGSCGDSALAVTLDSSAAVYLAGETYSADFPVTSDAQITKFPSTYTSGFVAELSPNLNQLLYSSFLGGGNFSTAHALALDGAGGLYVAGSTQASPTAGDSHALSGVGCPQPGPAPGPPLIQPPISGDNPFVMKMTLSAAPPIFVATVGGTCHGEADSLAFDAAGNIWLAGSNESLDFPRLAPIGGLGQIPPPYLNYYNAMMGFLAELNPSGSVLLSATVTDSFGSVAADSMAVYYAGELGDLNSSGVPTGNYAALVAEINPSQTAPIFIDEITQDSPLVPAASRIPSAVAPGEIVRIIGRGIGPQTQVGAKLTAGGSFATSMGGVQVTFNGVAAPLVTAQANQILAIAPFELNGLTSAAVQVQYNGQMSNTYTVPVLAQNTDILAVANSDWSANSASNPAQPGSVVAIFLTGLGQTNPPGIDGAINQAPLAQPTVAPAISFVGTYGASVAFLGAAAGEVAGVSQLNVVVGTPTSSQGVLDVTIGNFYTTATVYVAP